MSKVQASLPLHLVVHAHAHSSFSLPPYLSLSLFLPPSNVAMLVTLVAAHHCPFPIELLLPGNGRPRLFSPNSYQWTHIKEVGGERVKYLFTNSNFFYPFSKISSPRPCALLDLKLCSKKWMAGQH